MKEDDRDRATKEQEEKKRLMDEALAVAAAAKKAQQERALKEEVEKKRLSDEAAASTATLTTSLNEKATISEEKALDIPNEKKNEEILNVEGIETENLTEGDTTKSSEQAAWVSVQCRLVNAGAAGLKVAADVGANIAAATAEVTRTSLQKVIIFVISSSSLTFTDTQIYHLIHPLTPI